MNNKKNNINLRKQLCNLTQPISDADEYYVAYQYDLVHTEGFPVRGISIKYEEPLRDLFNQEKWKENINHVNKMIVMNDRTWMLLSLYKHVSPYLEAN